jgi:hypothetical protein
MEQSHIEARLANGNYEAFLVFLPSYSKSIASCLKHQKALGALIAATEARIERKEFRDPGDEMPMIREHREMTGWKPNMEATRIIMNIDGDPVFSWNPYLDVPDY